jgi:DNA-binding NarL/FixJ family response regulator
MSNVTPLRVMVVDDHPPIRQLVSLLLSRASGFEVRAPDLERWFEDVCEVRPNILLLDLALGDVDAVPFIPKVVARCPETMIAALTSLPAEDGEASALASGAFVFYEKDHISRLAHDLVEDHRLFLRALAGDDVLAPSALARKVAVTSPSLDARGGTGHLPVGRSARGRGGGRSPARHSQPPAQRPTGR